MPIELDEIKKTVGLVLGRRNVTPTDRIYEDLGAESADMLNLVVTLEEKYGIEIDEASVPSIRTVADLHGLVCRNAAEPHSRP